MKPGGQGPHVRDPSVLMQLTKVSHPPLLLKHSLMSVQCVAPVPLKPVGHAPQRREPNVLVQLVKMSQPP